MVIRASAWQELINRGFRFSFVGRQGTKLNGGEDQELCYALRLAGWRLWYDPRLSLQHFMPARRLEWHYLRRLVRQYGIDGVYIDSYIHNVRPSTRGLKRTIRPTWQWQSLNALKNVLQRKRKAVPDWLSPAEGNLDVLYTDIYMARLIELLRQRSEYRKRIKEIGQAPWW